MIDLLFDRLLTRYSRCWDKNIVGFVVLNLTFYVSFVPNFYGTSLFKNTVRTNSDLALQQTSFAFRQLTFKNDIVSGVVVERLWDRQSFRHPAGATIATIATLSFEPNRYKEYFDKK